MPISFTANTPSTSVFSTLHVLQEEGLSLAKRNGELEAAVRKLRAAGRDSEAEHQRVMSQVQQLESQLAKEQGRYAQASQAAGEQVVKSCGDCHSRIGMPQQR